MGGVRCALGVHCGGEGLDVHCGREGLVCPRCALWGEGVRCALWGGRG